MKTREYNGLDGKVESRSWIVKQNKGLFGILKGDYCRAVPIAAARAGQDRKPGRFGRPKLPLERNRFRARGRPGNPVARNGCTIGISNRWRQGRFALFMTEAGLVGCGIYDVKTAAEFGEAVAIAWGTPQHPLVEPEDLLDARIVEATPRARELGVEIGMTGRDAVERLLAAGCPWIESAPQRHREDKRQFFLFCLLCVSVSLWFNSCLLSREVGEEVLELLLLAVLDTLELLDLWPGSPRSASPDRRTSSGSACRRRRGRHLLQVGPQTRLVLSR